MADPNEHAKLNDILYASNKNIVFEDPILNSNSNIKYTVIAIMKKMDLNNIKKSRRVHTKMFLKIDLYVKL